MNQNSTMPSFVGEKIGNWHLEKFLGEGGMSVVYLGRHAWLPMEGAVKILRTEYYNDAQSLERFEQEAITAGKLEHENIIRVLDYGQDKNNYYFMVLELLSGNDLESLIDQAPFSARWCLEIFDQVALALMATHEAGIIHRDLKPSNIFLMPAEPFPKVKLFDFGVAKILFEEVDKKLTQTGMIVGTPAYLAPEQLIPKVPLTTSVDIYAFGVILYQLLTGKLPLEGDSLIEHAILILQQEPPLLGEERPEFANSKLEALLDQLLSKAPSSRLPNMMAVREALKEALPPNDPLDHESHYPVIPPINLDELTPQQTSLTKPTDPHNELIKSEFLSGADLNQQTPHLRMGHYQPTHEQDELDQRAKEEEKRREEEMLARLSEEVNAAEFINELLDNHDYSDDEFGEQTLLDGHVSLDLPPELMPPSPSLNKQETIQPLEKNPKNSSKASLESLFSKDEKMEGFVPENISDETAEKNATKKHNPSNSGLASINLKPMKTKTPPPSLPSHLESLDFNMPANHLSNKTEKEPESRQNSKFERQQSPTKQPQIRQDNIGRTGQVEKVARLDSSRSASHRTGTYEKTGSSQHTGAYPKTNSGEVVSPSRTGSLKQVASSSRTGSLKQVARAEPRRRGLAGSSSAELKKIDSNERMARLGTGAFNQKQGNNTSTKDSNASKRGVVVVGTGRATATASSGVSDSSVGIASPKRDKRIESNLASRNVAVASNIQGIVSNDTEGVLREQPQKDEFSKETKKTSDSPKTHSSPPNSSKSSSRNRINVLSRKEVNKKINASSQKSSIPSIRNFSELPSEKNKSFSIYLLIILLIVGIATFFALRFFLLDKKDESPSSSSSSSSSILTPHKKSCFLAQVKSSSHASLFNPPNPLQ